MARFVTVSRVPNVLSRGRVPLATFQNALHRPFSAPDNQSHNPLPTHNTVESSIRKEFRRVGAGARCLSTVACARARRHPARVSRARYFQSEKQPPFHNRLSRRSRLGSGGLCGVQRQVRDFAIPLVFEIRSDGVARGHNSFVFWKATVPHSRVRVGTLRSLFSDLKRPRRYEERTFLQIASPRPVGGAASRKSVQQRPGPSRGAVFHVAVHSREILLKQTRSRTNKRPSPKRFSRECLFSATRRAKTHALCANRRDTGLCVCVLLCV